MTEDEARKCWCPFKLNGFMAMLMPMAELNASYADLEKAAPVAMCNASECMAWRHEIGPGDDQSAFGYVGPTGRGFCGLAGKP